MVEDGKETQMAMSQSYITVRFMQPGSVVFDIESANVQPLQLIAIAHYLRMAGESHLVQQQIESAKKAEAAKIVVPEGKFVRKH